MATTTAKKVETNKVKIRLPLTRTEKDDVYVAVNGHSFLIKRGEEVEVPDYIAAALHDSETALEEAFAYEAQVADNS